MLSSRTFFWILVLELTLLGNHRIESIRNLPTTKTTTKATTTARAASRSSSGSSGNSNNNMTVSKLFQNPAKKPNILIIITDQERALQHWPESFSQDHLPAMERLKKNGLTFTHHYTNACMCSPSRSTLLTSQFPVKTGVTRTGSPGPPRHLPTDLPNLATVLKQAGYPKVEWHGKWHVGKTPADYGFDGWEPPDAGNYLSINDSLGGGTPDNDGRFLKNLCRSLEGYAATEADEDHQSQPFCIVASFVNPHDVYVAQHGPAKGYTHKDLHRLEVPLPPNYREDTDENNKPRCHGQMSSRYVPFECTPQEYVNFYAYLHTLVDAQIGKLLDKVDALGFTDSTLIVRTADHGEQGLSHSLVEKFFNCYQESLKIPLVVSNPIAFPQAQSTDALSSHVDLLPTLAGLVGIEDEAITSGLQGTNLAKLWDDPHLTTTIPTTTAGGGSTQTDETETIVGLQKSIHFTYDDIAFPGAPSTIRCLHKGRLKYAVYFTPDGRDTDWELYDLQTDPLEDHNLAGTPAYQDLQAQLEAELVETMVQKETLPQAFRWPPKPTRYSVGFDHPPGGKLERPSRARSRSRQREEDPIRSYKFCDEGDAVSVTLGIPGIGTKCSPEEDIDLIVTPEGLVALIIAKYLPERLSLTFGKPVAEITSASVALTEHELIVRLTKKDPTQTWESFHSLASSNHGAEE